jgi:hypothetical protein
MAMASAALARPAHLLGDGLQPQAEAVAYAHGQVTMRHRTSTCAMDMAGNGVLCCFCMAQNVTSSSRSRCGPSP